MRKAVTVGLNAYPNPANCLKGCLNDVRMMYDLLKGRGFEPDNIRVLTDERATTQAILEHIEWLVGSSRPDDILVFHYSGHGSQVRDRHGDELDDNKDEILCPYDLDWDNPLSDDILSEHFKKLPLGAKMYLFFDCCHSGSMDRDIQGNPTYRKARFLPPPLDIALRSEGRILSTRKIGLKQTITKPNGDCFTREILSLSAKPEQRHVMISGCKDDQTSADAFINGTYNGALTYHMVTTMLKLAENTVRDIHQRAKAAITLNGYSQESLLWGPDALLDLPFFG